MDKFFSLYGYKLAVAVGTHLMFVLVSVFIAFIIALVLGCALSRIPKVARYLIPLISVLQTIPGIVFIGLLFLILGMKPITVIVALAIYAVFPILKNIYTGLIEVPSTYKEASIGCGMTSFQSLLKVEIPLVLPAIMNGLRMSTIYTVSWAVLASMIGLGGLGDFIYIGVSTNNNTLIIAGAIPAAIMAIVLGGLIDVLKRVMIPAVLRRDIL
ncbi:ABC transporter permease [Neisseria sp. Ec49-e6-T10]|uniref:ABC transporter permease n=1 Tax=Neisseria sp. Ec49-e6-T10 TaxID=3140744 RepID=UPI003EBA3CBF